MVEMVETEINCRWLLSLPEHRADRPEWPYWEKERLASMHANLRPGWTVVDVGTEEGDLSALFASWVTADGAPGRIWLAEPNPRVWPNVRAIFEANDLTAAVAGCHVGFVSHTAHDDAYAWQEPWPDCAYGPLIGDHGFMTTWENPSAPTTTIDRLNVGGVDAITMDVEGAELDVLVGAERTLADDRPLVWTSVHPDFLPQYGATAERLYAYMESIGYRGELLAVDHEHHWLWWHEDSQPPVLPYAT